MDYIIAATYQDAKVVEARGWLWGISGNGDSKVRYICSMAKQINLFCPDLFTI